MRKGLPRTLLRKVRECAKAIALQSRAAPGAGSAQQPKRVHHPAAPILDYFVVGKTLGAIDGVARCMSLLE